VEVAAGAVVVVVVVCALAALPNSEAPMAPPAIIDPRIADPTSAFNLTFILVSLLPCPEPFRQWCYGAAGASEDAQDAPTGGWALAHKTLRANRPRRMGRDPSGYNPPKVPLKAPGKKQRRPARRRVVTNVKEAP